ncbi:prolipoprotein diacylglyceryl transferase [Massilicoli timonensis]|uniref:prolipoprotein diacylglyceryl transferase n=1 Tax=Massilicoli timonensis TaxID=2015901 RepID=UPI003CCBE44F
MNFDLAFFPDMKTFVSFGSLSITWYAVLILTGAFLAYLLSLRIFRKWGYDDEIFENYFLMMFPIAIIGARIWYVLFEWEQYADNWVKVFYVWEGGLAIHGGLLAAIGFGWFYFRRHGVDGLRVADVALPHVMLAQVIGRWGNFMNQEAFGEIVPESYFDHFPAFIKDQMYISGHYHMPTFLYEGIGNLIGFILIMFVYRKYGRKKRGDLAYAYIAWYGMVRFFVEGLRTDSLMFGGIRVAQAVSVIGVLFGVCGILGVWNKMFAKFYPWRKEKPVVLFDLDGTLVDTKELIFQSFRHVFAQYKPDHTLSEEELQSFLGPTLKQSFARYFDVSMSDELIACYREYNHREHDRYVKEFAGVKETLDYLRSNGYAMAVVSNKTKHTVAMGLEKFGLEEYFPVIIGCEEIKEPKPDPSGILEACKALYRGHDNVIYVGDSASDVQAAKNMGGFSVACVFDEAKEAELTQSKPCALIHHMEELIELVKEDREWEDRTIY